MTTVEVNGETISIKPSVSRFQKSAYQISQLIYHYFAQIGITKDYIKLELPRNPLKFDAHAEIAWSVNGEDFYYQCSTQETYRDNLGVISQVIKTESYAIRNGLKSFAQVMNQFKLGYDEEGEKIRTPREILQIPDGVTDVNYVKFKFRELSKQFHPDTGGDPKKFSELQKAKDELLRELGDG